MRRRSDIRYLQSKRFHGIDFTAIAFDCNFSREQDDDGPDANDVRTTRKIH